MANLVSPKSINTLATAHGISYEQVAFDRFESSYSQTGKVTKCGLIVSDSVPYLAASPDGLVGMDSILEIKCPYQARDREISHISIPYLKETDNVLSLNKNHNYFYQIQGQLFCSKRKCCFFCVYTFKDFKIFEILRDESFIEKMNEQLKTFYKDYFRPAYLDKHLYKFHDKYFQ